MGVSVATILPQLTRFAGVETVVKKRQGVDDIVNGILKTHGQYKNEYQKICKHFLKPTIKETCKEIFNFLKTNVPYNIEPESYQTLRSPAAILSLPADCKSYALFSAGVIDALRNCGAIDCGLKFRFAGYDMFNNNIEHVFCVVTDGNNEFWIDPVLSTFDEKKQPVYIVDKNIKNMSLVGIAGVGATPRPSAGFLQQIQKGVSDIKKTQSGLQKATGFLSDAAALVPGWGTAISAVLKVFNFGKVQSPDFWRGWAALDSKAGLMLGTNAATWVFQDGDSVQNEGVNLISWINNYGLETIVNENPHIKQRFGKFITVNDLANKLRRGGFNQEADAIIQAATQLPGGGGGGALQMGGGNMLTTLLLVGAGVFVVSKFAKK
jgi:hypothetical protein